MIILNWLVEEAIQDDTNITEILKEMGVSYKVFTTADYFNENYNHFPTCENVFFYGSVQVAEQIRKRNLWTPGTIGNLTDYQCSSFYPIIGDEMLNHEYALIPLNDVRRLWPFYQKIFDNENLFLRPNCGDKLFAGQVVEDINDFFKKEEMYINEKNNRELCLVSSAYKIEAEYRLLIYKNKVKSGSQYKLNGKKNRNASVPDAVVNFANELLCKLNITIDDVFMLDVATVNNKNYCLEINMASSSGLYDIPPKTFIETVNESFHNKT